MIESNIISWVDLGDNLQCLDVYRMTKWIRFFNFIKVMMSFKKFSILFYVLIKALFFLQMMMLTLTNVTDENDTMVQIFKSLSSVIFVQDIVSDLSSYKMAVLIVTALNVLSISFIIFLMISMKIGKFVTKMPLVLLNFINVLVSNYLIGPIIIISILATKCVNGVHIYLNVVCYSDTTHILILAVSAFNLLYFLIMMIILAMYYNEIGTIGDTKFLSRINCNYELYSTIVKISMFVLSYYVKFYSNGSSNSLILMQSYMIFFSFVLVIYTYKKVFFFDTRINAIILYGWVMVFWFSCVILIKSILKINDTSIFHLAGWVLLSTIVYYLEDSYEEYLLTEFNIFEAKSLKEVEVFNFKLFSLLNQRSAKSITMIVGIINKFEEVVFKSSDELRDKYKQLMSNNKLKKKYNSTSAVSVLSILYIVYEHHLEKSVLKDDVLLNICYFLINRFRNMTYAAFLLSKIKAVSHKHLYLKYLLMEEIKESQITKLAKSNNKDSVKHIQIGSVILYNTYIELFNTKIFDATCNQIDYFDTLRNNVNSSKTTDNFLQLGEDILIMRREILNVWDKIIELNPFSEECFKDYMIYLETILQDDTLAKSENKKFFNFRANKISEKHNVYHSMFNYNSGVLLVDGYFSFGRVLYATPNLPLMFNFSSKDAANMTIDDLTPNVIKEIHKEVINYGVKYSNLKTLFGTPRDIILKGKTGSIFNIKVSIKCVPNLSYGLIYILNVSKLPDNNFVIVLDTEFKIDGLTELYSQGTIFTSNPYSIDRSVVSCHAAVLIPSILLDLLYNDKQGFHIAKEEADNKCVLYTLSSNKSINDKIELLVEKIKQSGRLLINDDNSTLLQEYEELVKEISSKSTQSVSVFYKVVTQQLMMGKFKYYKINVSSDLFSLSDSLPTKEVKQDKVKENSNSKLIVNLESKNRIKVKLLNQFIVSGEEHDKLIEEGGKEGDKEGDKEGENKKKENKDNNSFSLGPKTSSKTSVDPSSFNKLKNKILVKTEVSAISYMKYLSFSFGLGTILLVFFASQNSNTKFTNLNEYLLENLFFNHSKIIVSCVYLSTLNLKFMRDGIYTQDHCYSPCEAFYSTALAGCISEIKLHKQNSSTFYPDFTTVLSRQKNITFKLYNMTATDTIVIDVNNSMNLLVALGLKINSNLNDYFRNPVTQIDTASDNLLSQSLLFLNDPLITGFTDDVKQANITAQFSTLNIVLIIEAGLFGILMIAFIYLICSLYSIEAFYLKQLIIFRNAPFDAYLKKLDEVRKRLRNDNGGENVENLNEELEEAKAKDSKRSKDGDDKDKDGKKKDKKKKNDEDNEEDKEKKGIKRKKKRGGFSYQDEKIKIMGNYFLFLNIFFCVKVIAILLLSASYYVLVSVIDQTSQTQLLSSDSTSNQIESVFKESFDIYRRLKTELGNYIDNEVTKQSLADYLTNNTDSSVIFNGIQYTKAIDILNSNYYDMQLPQQVITPKIGNLLMPLVNTDLTTASAAIKTLNNLYNLNSCAVLFDPISQKLDYDYCANFWSNILIKGMEQAITQMSVVVTTVLDDLHSLNLQKKLLADVIAANSPFSGYELFVEFYLFKSYMATISIFNLLNAGNLQVLYNLSQLIMIAYICFVVVLFSFLIYFVHLSKDVFNTFMNFIGIMPAKYFMEDQNLYKEILKLEQYLY